MHGEHADQLSPLLRENGIRAYHELCRLGCDRKIIGGLFLLLAAPESIELSKGRTLALRSLDSWETALGGLSLQELDQIVDDAKELQKKVLRLRQTPLVRDLNAKDHFPEWDLLAGAPVFSLPIRSEEPTQLLQFEGLLSLPELARRCGPRQKPDHNRLRRKIHLYIRENTTDKEWHDNLVADILNDLFPNPENPQYDGSVKQWRYYHDLTGQAA